MEKNKCQPGFFRFSKLGKRFLLTNEVGDFIFLTEKQFDDFNSGNLSRDSVLGKKLEAGDFLKHDLPCDRMVENYRQRNAFLNSAGPTLHIVVVTKRCNHRCVYCQTNSHVDGKEFDMSKQTAKKTVDFIFATPNKNIAIEFQGGEPLLNWPVVKFITEYAWQKNKAYKKDLQLRLVSNLSLMDQQKMKFLFDNQVSICTSLDGPQKIHDKNRVFPGQSSYQQVSFWLEKMNQEYEKRRKRKINKYIFKPSALLTVSRFSLNYAKEIVAEYVRWGIPIISVRPVNSLGMAQSVWQKIGYSSDDFLRFYKEIVNEMIKWNKKGNFIKEFNMATALKQILTNEASTFLDLRSPCGAVLGQLLYFFDGSIYSCDEGRMVAGDQFKLGNVYEDNFKDILQSQKAKTLCVASCLENSACDFCVFKPYCGTCPVLNFVDYGNIFMPGPMSERCNINKKKLEFTFLLLRNKEHKKILEKWVGGWETKDGS